MDPIAFFLSKPVVLIVALALAYVGLWPKATIWVVRMTGKMGWAERRFGEGGTFTVWKIIGVAASIGGIIYLFS